MGQPTIFDTFNNRFGTKPRIQTEGKQKIHVDEQKKKLRKLKKESKRKYKELIRSAADEQEVTDERTKWNKLVRLHNKIRLQELEVQKVEEQATNNTEFSKNPFDFIKHHVTKGKPSNLKPACNIDEATKFFTDRYEDKTRDEKLDFPFFIPLAATPSSPIDIDPPSKVEIDEYVKSRRNKSSPGPDGIPYLIYKKCPKIRDFMIYLIRECWVNCVIPDRDKLALKFLLPKTESSTNLDDFRDITLFNAFIKVLFGVWARRVTKFMIKNKFINTNIQKGFVPNISGCVEHNQTLHDVLKNDKRDGKPVQVTFLDLKNAFGSIKHNFIVAALRWYHVPEQFINIFKLLYSNCHVVVKVNNDLTPPIPVKIGSLQGGPEAGICFNIPWNIPLEAIYIKARDLGAIPEDKPVSAFADDLTTKTNDDTKMQTLLNFISSTFDWSKCLQLNTKKCKVLCINERGEPSNVDLTLNGKKINHLENSPFKFLGRWIYPSLSDVDNRRHVVVKFENLMGKVNDLALDGKKKAWIYQFGVLPYIAWDFMMYELNQTTIKKLEATSNKFLKKWLRLAKCADPSIIYRTEAGLNIENVRNYVLASRLNVELTTATSRDPLVRLSAKRRRDEEIDKDGWTPTKKMKQAVEDIEFQKRFMSNTRRVGDRRGLNTSLKPKLNKRSVILRAKQLTDEERISKILQLSQQSKWYEWQDLINLDLKWNEIMYSYSPSMLSFLINSIQDTLPDPVNLRRWSKSKEANCSLCGWKFCSQIHILCSCKVALDQGRISWRHDSILNAIEKWIKSSKLSSTKNNTANDDHYLDGPLKTTLPDSLSMSFVKEGTKVKRNTKKKQHGNWWGVAKDWKILVDRRDQQYQIPPEIAASNLRPDMCIYSLAIKKCLFVELTSPFEDNIAKWKLKKSDKYSELVNQARHNGWTTVLKTVEVGARGFVNADSLKLFRMVGLSSKQCNNIRRELSTIAIRTSHFIWLNRNNSEWTKPVRISR